MFMAVPDASKLDFLEAALGAGGTTENWNVQLYTNDYTPDDDSTPGDFTAATFTGAGAFSVDTTNWGSAVISSHVANITNSNTPHWTNSGVTT